MPVTIKGAFGMFRGI